MTEKNDYIVSVDKFERQLQYFASNGYCTPSLENVLNKRIDFVRGSRKPLLITFDDGYLDTLENAAPLLLKHGFSAIVFVMSDFTRERNWWDLPENMASAKLMNAEQIKAMDKLGIEIGSHGLSHRSLPLLSDAELANEISEAKNVLDRVLGKPVRYFAYPFGDVDERVARIVQAMGYSCAFATNQGPWSFYGDMFQIRRTLISDRADSGYLNFKLSGLEKGIRWMWSVSKEITGRKPRYNER